MSDNDVFSNTNTPDPLTSPEDLLLTIKNEQGEPKYKTVADAIKALASSQAFIPQLLSEKKTQEEELIRLREEAKRIDNIDEVLKKLTANEAIQKPNGETTPAGLSAETVTELVRKELESREINNTAKANIMTVQKALTEKFGDKTKEVVARKAAELGVSPEKLGELSATAPAMVLTLFQTVAKSNPTPTTSSVSLPSFKTDGTTVEAPKKSVLLGSTSREQKAHMMEHKAAVYKRLGIEA